MKIIVIALTVLLIAFGLVRFFYEKKFKPSVALYLLFTEVVICIVAIALSVVAKLYYGLFIAILILIIIEIIIKFVLKKI